MRKELFDGRRIASIELAQAELDPWAVHYNHEREHQAIGDVAPIRRFELFERTPAVVVDPDGSGEDETAPDVESADGLLNVTHNGVLVATHARRHMAEDDDRMDPRAKVARAARPTTGEEVLRKVDPSGSVSFAGTTYRLRTADTGSGTCMAAAADMNPTTLTSPLPASTP